MATLRIDLQGGFENDAVEVYVDEELRWSDDAVTTNLSLDLATSAPIDAPDGPADVRIVVSGKNLEETVEALVAGETYIVARVEGGRLVVEQLAEAPYYL